MRAVVLGHVDKLAAEIAHVALLVLHVVDRHGRRYRQLGFGLDDVEVAVHHALNVGHIGDDREHLVQVKLGEREREVLLGVTVGVV